MTHLLGEQKQNGYFQANCVTSGFPSKTQQGQTAPVALEEELHSLCRWALPFYGPKSFIKIPALLTTE